MDWIKKNSKLIIFCVIIIVILVLNHIFGWSKYLSDSENLKFLSSMIHEHFAMAALIYIGLTIVACVVLALPGVTFAILAGAIFGPWWGTLFCLIATTLGAIIAFIVGRFFLKDSIKPMVEKNALLKKILSEAGSEEAAQALMAEMDKDITAFSEKRKALRQPKKSSSDDEPPPWMDEFEYIDWVITH